MEKSRGSLGEGRRVSLTYEPSSDIFPLALLLCAGRSGASGDVQQTKRLEQAIKALEFLFKFGNYLE